MKPDQKGILRIVHATFNSLRGFRLGWQSEAAVRQDIALCIVLAAVALIVPVSTVEKILMFGSLLLLLIVEFLNTSVEAAIDRIGPERHELSGKAKDTASTAVFFALANIALTYGLILWQFL